MCEVERSACMGRHQSMQKMCSWYGLKEGKIEPELQAGVVPSECIPLEKFVKGHVVFPNIPSIQLFFHFAQRRSRIVRLPIAGIIPRMLSTRLTRSVSNLSGLVSRKDFVSNALSSLAMCFLFHDHQP